MNLWKRHVCGFVVSACWAGAAPASESLIELTTGGLDFGKIADPASIVLESEDVRVSQSNVSFRYRLSTPGPALARVDLTFHYPKLDFSDPDATYAIPGADPVNFLDAKVKIGGASVGLSLSQSATLDGKDVTPALRNAKLPLVPVGAFRSQIEAVPPAVRQTLQADGLIKEVGRTIDGKPLLFPAWSVRTEGTRSITIEPGKPVDIELGYVPSVGISQDSPLRKALRDNKGLAANVAAHRSAFCTDRPFLKGLDAMAGGDEANTARITELRIRLLMRNAAAPPLPAVAYRLSVDKGKPSRIVSFCSDNLQKTSPTTFVATLSNYSPKPQFNVLMIESEAPLPSPSPAPPRTTSPAAPPSTGIDPAGRW